MSKVDSEQELQNKIFQIRYLENYLADLINKENFIVASLNDLENAEATIETLSKGKSFDTLVYIGGGMYTPSKMDNLNKVLVNIGSNVVIEKSLNDAQMYLKERKIEIRNALNELTKQKQQVAYALQTLKENVEAVIKESQSE
ncbi:MAG: prefoldin subunit alpha [Nitrososphaeria archaeon]